MLLFLQSQSHCFPIKDMLVINITHLNIGLINHSNPCQHEKWTLHNDDEDGNNDDDNNNNDDLRLKISTIINTLRIFISICYPFILNVHLNTNMFLLTRDSSRNQRGRLKPTGNLFFISINIPHPLHPSESHPLSLLICI